MEELTEKTIDYAERASRGGTARMNEMSAEEKRALGRKAANARWGKAGNRKKKTAKPAKQKATRNTSALQPKVFGIALTAAEKSYAKSLEDLAYHENMVAILRARIPSLERTISALQNQQNPTSFPQTNVYGSIPHTMPSTDISTRHPDVSRAQGAAVGGIDLTDETDEDKFLRESGLPGGEWR
jgi:hypothetical protein